VVRQFGSCGFEILGDLTMLEQFESNRKRENLLVLGGVDAIKRFFRSVGLPLG
jgi:hypothetical protein